MCCMRFIVIQALVCVCACRCGVPVNNSQQDDDDDNVVGESIMFRASKLTRPVRASLALTDKLFVRTLLCAVCFCVRMCSLFSEHVFFLIVLYVVFACKQCSVAAAVAAAPYYYGSRS